MPWHRLRFTLYITACLLIGAIHALGSLALGYHPRLEAWLARRT